MTTSRLSAKNCNYLYIFGILFSIFILFPVLLGFDYSKNLITFFGYLYFCVFIIKIYLFAYGFFLYRKIKYYDEIDDILNDKYLEIYTILVPLYKEKYETILGLVLSIKNIEYPIDKIDLKLIVEDDDNSTKEIVLKLQERYSFINIVVVPNGDIKTKPRACNYALKTAKGKYLTVFDAEDRPELYQLKKAVAAFKKYPDNYVCLQASLNYYNKYENFYSKCFSVEYSMWFDFTIRALEKLKLFFPLGGTSNHFKTEKLIELGGWDSYNVTEDADLGVVIARAGYKIGIINSITDEEAPTSFKRWIKQRSRWIKGFIQTFCVHFKKPIKLYKDLGFKNFIIFTTFVLISFLYFLSLPFILLLGIVLSLKFNNFNIIDTQLIIGILVIYLVYWMIVFRNNLEGMFWNSFCFPFYWALHSIASIVSIIQIIRKPFYWDKTEHGLSKIINFKE